MKKKTLIIIAIIVALVVCAAIFFRPVNLLNEDSSVDSGLIVYYKYSDDRMFSESEQIDVSGYEKELADYLKAVKVRRTLSSKNNLQAARLDLMLTCSSKIVNLNLSHYVSYASINGKYYVPLDPEKVIYDLLDILGIEDDFPFETITY